MKSAINRCLSGFLLCILFLAAPSAALGQESWMGPLELKPQFPLTLPLLSISPEKASILPPGEEKSSWDLNYSNIFIIVASPGWEIGMDMEMAQLSYRYQRGISENIEVGGEVPVLSFGGGFMDPFLTGFHRFFGIPDYRYARPYNDFQYYIRRNGRDVIAPVNGKAGLGDATFYGKMALRKEDPKISLKVAVQAPTGDPLLGFGNGSWDYAAAVFMDKELSEYSKLYGGAGYSLLGDWAGLEVLSFSSYWYGFLAYEQAYGRWNLAGQLQVANSPFPLTGIYQVDNTVFSGSAGVGYRLTEGQMITFSVTEDLNFSGGPDITLHLGYENFLR